MKKLIIGNWKMNGGVDLLNSFIELMNNEGFVIALPFHLICLARHLNNNARIAAQNCSVYGGNGAYTGEISAQMLRESGVEYVIVGHSERRTLFGETAATINRKIANCVEARIGIIYCVSESYQKQIIDDLRGIDESVSEMMVAYEPVSSIGTGIVPTPDKIETAVKNIRYCFETSNNIKPSKFLYGGSVSRANIDTLAKIQHNVDGFLVGGASLSANEIREMLDYSSFS
jgi:triosephosphate isomerase